MAATRACFVALMVALAFLFSEAAAAAGTADGQRRRRQVRRLLSGSTKKGPVASIESPDGDTIDCVHISKQPAFDHPLLKNHTTQMRPSYHPEGLYDDSNIAQHPIIQTWHQKGMCPENTIPIRRTREEDVLRASSVKRYGKKTTRSIPKVVSIDDPNANATIGHQVYPKRYLDSNSRLFIYWTRDAYQTTGCYNLDCPGFIQTNNLVALGGSISPDSLYGGSQYDIDILIWKDPKGGNWWLQVGGYILGYWPFSMFSYLADSASNVMWGGEVYSPDAGQTLTQMGSGHFPEEGFGKASYIRNIQVVDSSNYLKSPSGVYLGSEQPNCYNVQNGTNINWCTYIFYGGPGKNPNCP